MGLVEYAIGVLSGAHRADPFRERAPQRPVTLADLEKAAGWDALVVQYGLPPEANALSTGGLRFSRLFPQMFLQRTQGRVPAVLTLQEASEWVRAAACEFSKVK